MDTSDFALLKIYDMDTDTRVLIFSLDYSWKNEIFIIYTFF